jgi:hypothetical protein
MSVVPGMAQKVFSGISPSDFAACKKFLSENPTDTVVGVKRVAVDDPGKFAVSGVQPGDTLMMITKVFVGTDGRIKRQPIFVKEEVSSETVVDFETADAVDRAAAQTQAAEKLAAGKQRDTLYYQSSVAVATDGKVIKKAANMWGGGIAAEAGYRGGDGISGFTAAIGPSYSWSWGRCDAMFRLARSKYSYNAEAENADKPFTTLGLRLGGDLRVPISLDAYNQWNIYVGGGVGLDFFMTDSKTDEYNGVLKSEGSDPYSFARLTLAYRFFATGNEAYLRIGWEQNPLTIQNVSEKQHINCWWITAGVNFGVLRDWVTTK